MKVTLCTKKATNNKNKKPKEMRIVTQKKNKTNWTKHGRKQSKTDVLIGGNYL